MQSIKCSNCGLVNFATAQFCKRCHQTLESQNPQNSYQTKIYESNFSTTIRETVPSFENEIEYALPRFPADLRPAEFQTAPLPNAPPYYEQAAYFQPMPFVNYQPVAFVRSGFDIRLHKQARLPAVCIGCGKNLHSTVDGDYFPQKYRWHNPLLYIALISPLIYCILAACLSERFTVALPLCHDHLTTRNRNRNYIFGIGIAAPVLIFVLFAGGFAGFGFLIFLALLLGLPLGYEYAVKPLHVRSVEGEYVILHGASTEFLNKLPY